jgi:hypothetical protein
MLATWSALLTPKVASVGDRKGSELAVIHVAAVPKETTHEEVHNHADRC